MNTIFNSVSMSVARIDPRTLKFFFAVLSFVLVIMGAPDGDGGVAG